MAKRRDRTAYNRAWRVKNPARYRAICRQAAKVARRKFPEKNRARCAVYYAVKTGKLKKQPCWCGETKVQAHHADYSKPLEVTWLCTKHHIEVERTTRGN